MPLRTAALCFMSAALGLVAGSSLRGSGGIGDDAPEARQPWTSRVPVLNRIVGTAIEDVAQESLKSDDLAEVDAIVALAIENPAVAVRAAAAIDNDWLRRDTVERVVSVWAAEAPTEALSYVDAARDLFDAKRSSRILILEIWARADPVGALNFFSGPVGRDLFFTDQQTARRTAGAIADADPYLMLSRSDVQPTGYIGSQFRAAAIDVIVERDPEFALRQIALAASDTERAEWEWRLRFAEERRLAEE